MKKTALIFPILLFLFSCSNSPEQKQKGTLKYFDVSSYFEKEADRLRKFNPLINKTVEIDGVRETKKIKIADWKKELAIFSEADINKGSWRGSFKLKKEQDRETYISDNEKIPVKEVEVNYTSNKLRKLLIVVKNDNSLYTSMDSLIYYPDSLYQIIKFQKVKLMQEKNYKVTAKIISGSKPGL